MLKTLTDLLEIQAFEGPVEVYASDPHHDPLPAMIKDISIHVSGFKKNGLG